ncbi:MAG TPA: helix-turn-helix transcriptional regulator [Candidatus Kapabacteria bacterium]|nr:helix-turn-helix transcriptional regulator [Candidatus Kapabacteria bacterium]
MPDNDQEIGSNLRTVRQDRSLTQAQLAALVGVSRQTINYIEQGTYCPSTRLALQLADVLGVVVEDLFYLTHGASAKSRS